MTRNFRLRAALQPSINVAREGIDRSFLTMQVTVDGQTLFPLPTANCSQAALQMGSDFLPGIQS